MQRVGEHVAECSICLAALEQVPEDSMVRLLGEHRSEIDGSLGELGAGRAPGEDSRHLPEEELRNAPPDLVPTGSFTPVEEPEVGPSAGGPFQHPRYQVRASLGRGGMGLIYLADDRVENRPVVLKFLREDLLDHPRLVERFRREAAAATRLKHPNIVTSTGPRRSDAGRSW